MFKRITKKTIRTIYRPIKRSRFIFYLLFVSTLACMGLSDLPKEPAPLPPLERHSGRAWRVEILIEKNTLDRVPYNDRSYIRSVGGLVYSISLDETAASIIPWPETWEERFTKYLQPSRYIESNDEGIKSALNYLIEKGGAEPQNVPIHHAAKIIIKHCLEHIESDGQFTDSKNGLTTGFRVQGARATAKEGKGSATDLVCVCVATLRAAGIPARPVIGFTNANAAGNSSVDPYCMVWGEYALPGAGWVPFVPERMRGTVKGLGTEDPWQGLGTLPFFNRRVPVAVEFESNSIAGPYRNIRMFLISSPQEAQ